VKPPVQPNLVQLKSQGGGKLGDSSDDEAITPVPLEGNSKSVKTADLAKDAVSLT